MSRVISHTGESFSGRPTSCGNGTGSYAATFDTISNPTNGCANTSNSNYGSLRPKTSLGYYRYNFDCSSIPENATITNISCSVKVRVSNSSGISVGTIQLATGNTLKGSSYDFHTSTNTNVTSLTTGSWTRAELDDIYLLISGQRSSNNRYIYFYGADLSITYSWNEVQYQITATSYSQTSASVTVPNTWVVEGESTTLTVNNVQNLLFLGVYDNNINVSQDLVHTSGTTYTYTISDISDDHEIVLEDVTAYDVSVISTSSNITNLIPASGTTEQVGEDTAYEVKIYTSHLDRIYVKNNDVIVNDQLVSETPHEAGTFTFNPSSYSNNTLRSNGNLTYGYNSTSNTSNYARLEASTGTTQSIDYNFDLSSIPQTATIISVACSFRIYVSGSYSQSYTNVQLFSGTTSKSNANSSWYNQTSSNIYNLSGIGTFTRAELDNVYIKISGRAGRSGRYMYFGGANLDVTYEYNGETYYLYTAIIQEDTTIKIEDRPIRTITTSSTSASATISSSVSSGYEGYSSVITVNVSDISLVSILDNGVNIVSQFSGSGGTYTYTLSNITANHTIVVSEVVTSKIYRKIGGSYVQVTVYKKISGS